MSESITPVQPKTKLS